MRKILIAPVHNAPQNMERSYKKKVQGTRRNRVFSSKLGFFALNLRACLKSHLIRLGLT